MSTYTQDITHLIGKINTNLPDNDTQAITAARIRDAMGAVAYNYDLYVLKTDLDAAGYVTASALSGYATQDDLQTGMQSVLDDSYAYVVEKINEIPGVDLSAYVTKTELSGMGYITSADLPDMSSYATKTYVADYVATHTGPVDLSAYVTKDELSAAGYLTAVPSEYITDTELSSMGYITSSALGDYVTETELSQAGYLTSIPSEYITDTELSNVLSTASYVTQNELSNAGYITNSDLSQASYVTQQALSAMGYITSSDLPDLSAYVDYDSLQSYLGSYVTQSQLNQELGSYATLSYLETYYATNESLSAGINFIEDQLIAANVLVTDPETGDWAPDSMASQSYVADYVSTYVPMPDLSSYVDYDSLQSYLGSYVTKDELSAAGYLTAIPSEYVTESEITSMGYVTESQLQSTLTAYITETELSNMGYITSSDIPSIPVIDENLIPNTTNTYTLGDSSHIYKSTYTSKLYLGSNITIAPESNAQTGSDITININGAQKFYLNSNRFAPNGSSNNKAIDLGTSDRMWGYTYSANFIENGTNISDIYATTTQLNSKQDTLVSGTNIKTINNESLLGSGNIDIQAGGTPDYSHVLTFTATQANSTIKLNRVGTSTSLTNAVLQYSTDNGANWTNYTLGGTITLTAVGDSVMFKGTNTTLGVDTSNYHQFVMTGKISASGDITSLFNETGGDIIMPAYGCFDLFNSCSSLTKAPELPATALGIWCYTNMFLRCTSLTKAPELPATTLTDYCYASMFSSCIALKEAPELPATTLAQYCYTSMFNGCSSLTKAPELPAMTLAQYCYQYMFTNCSSLTKAPELPATTLTDYCYNAMFQGCSSLTKAPELPATTLAQYCYYYMFNGCTSLTKAPELPAMTLSQGCYYYMFGGCTSLTKAPELPATDISQFGCYRYMFYGCTHLNYVKAMILSDMSSVSNNTFSWMSNVPATGVFVMNNNAAWDPEQVRGSNGVPTGWTVYKTISIDTDDFPESYVEDNGKGLQVVNGAWQKVSGLLTSANLIYDSTTNTLTINV